MEEEKPGKTDSTGEIIPYVSLSLSAWIFSLSLFPFLFLYFTFIYSPKRAGNGGRSVWRQERKKEKGKNEGTF